MADLASVFGDCGWFRETVAAWIDGFLERAAVDELIVTGVIYDHDARLKSFGIAAEVLRERVG